MIPTDGNDWLRLLIGALKGVVENLFREPTVKVDFSVRRVEPFNVFMSIDVMPEGFDEDDDSTAIYISEWAELDAAVDATINADYKPNYFANSLRGIAKEFRRHAERLDAAATVHEQQTESAA